MKISSKLIAFSLAAFAPISASASIPVFQGNQGKTITLEKFEPKSIYGQWTLSSGNGLGGKWKDATFFTIDYANLDFFKRQIEVMTNEGAAQMDIEIMWKNKETIEQTLTYYAYDDYAIHNDNPKIQLPRIIHAFRRNPDLFENFKDTHDQRSVLLKGYNSLGGTILSEPYVPYNFEGKTVRRYNAQSAFDNALAKLKNEKPNFDFFNSVDIHFIRHDVIYGLDIVDDETIIIYEISNDLSYAVLKRVPDNKLYEVKGYRQILDEIKG